MTLDSLMQEHTDRVFLNPDHFAETVTVQPHGKPEREVTAVVYESEKREDDAQQHKKDVQEIDVLFKRDATDGITEAEAERRLTIKRADNPQKAYRFERITNNNPSGITCRFVHGTIRDYGNPKTDL